MHHVSLADRSRTDCKAAAQVYEHFEKVISLRD